MPAAAAAARRRSMMVVACSMAAVACYRPQLRDCTVTCDDQTGCPGDLRCFGGYCSHGATCAPPDAGADGSDAGGGQTPADGPADSSRERVVFEADALPSALPNMLLWLDPDYVETTSDTFVWRDRSGMQHDATASGAARPTLVPAQDGRPPTLELSGAGQYLTLPAFMGRVGSTFVVAWPRPAVVADQPDAGAAADVMSVLDFSMQAGASFNAVQYGIGSHQLLYTAFYDDRNLGPNPAFDPGGNGSLQLFEVVPLGIAQPDIASALHYKNGVEIGETSTYASATVHTSNFIGHSNVPGQPGSADFRGTIGEIVIYGYVLTDADRKRVESYLLGRWWLPRGGGGP